MSGPKRYDFVLGYHQKKKKKKEEEGEEGGRDGEWVYLRDGGVLGDLLRTEIGIDVEGEDMEG